MTLPIPSLKLSLLFLLALGLCALLTRYLLRYQKESIGFDKPDEHRKKHGRAISRLGGLPIFLTLSAGMLYMAADLPLQPVWWTIGLCSTLIFAIGFLDDLKPLGARVKLVGQIGVACIFYALGTSIDVVTHPTSHENLFLGWWSPVVTILWLIAIPNIINLIDGMDGLATGFGLFLCLTLAFVGHFAAMPEVVMISTMMAGALAGFLLFNFPPAKIFLGDGGAYLIGFFIASVSMTSSRKGYILGALLVMIVALGIPILDTLFAIMRRAIRGVPLFRADAEHIHHRLISLGYSKGQALAVLYATGAVLSLIGIFLLSSRGHGTVITAAVLAISSLAVARYLGYIKSYRGLRQQIHRALERRRDLEYARAHGRVLELEADRLPSAAEFVELLTRISHRLDFTLRPEQGRTTDAIPLANGLIWRVGRIDLELPDDVWRMRMEALQAGVQRALSRWHKLPGVMAEPAGAEGRAEHSLDGSPVPPHSTVQ